MSHSGQHPCPSKPHRVAQSLLPSIFLTCTPISLCMFHCIISLQQYRHYTPSPLRLQIHVLYFDSSCAWRLAYFMYKSHNQFSFQKKSVLRLRPTSTMSEEILSRMGHRASIYSHRTTTKSRSLHPIRASRRGTPRLLLVSFISKQKSRQKL